MVSVRIYGVFLVFLLNLSLVSMAQAQDDINLIEATILPADTLEVEINDVSEGDELYLNLTMGEDDSLSLTIYQGTNQMPINEVYNGRFSGTFEVNITLRTGLHMMYLYNPSLEHSIMISGFWTLNYTAVITNTTTTGTTNTTTTTTNGTTWTGPNGPTQRPIDYLNVLVNVMIGFVIPVLVVLLFVYCLCNRYKAEDYDYLLVFKEDEMREKSDE